MRKMSTFIFMFLFLISCIKIFADVSSLPRKSIVQTDIVRVYDNLGNSYGVNWSDYLRMATAGINWNYINTTTGGINWTDPAKTYIGG